MVFGGRQTQGGQLRPEPVFRISPTSQHHAKRHGLDIGPRQHVRHTAILASESGTISNARNPDTDRQRYIAKPGLLTYNRAMITLTEVKSLAFELPEQQRAALAAQILDSLPPLFSDSDDGIAEAARRDTEMDSDPGIGISLQQFDNLIAERR